MHRDECLISTVEEATEWLARYRHTVGTFDPQVLKVIELLEAGVRQANDDVQGQLDEQKEELDLVSEEHAKMKEALEKVIELAEQFQDTDFELDLDDPDTADYQKAAFQMSCDVIKEASDAL